MQENLQASAAEQLALLPTPPEEPQRRSWTGHRRAPKRSSFSAWVHRDAELYAALEVAEDIGDARQIEQARRRWKEHLRTIPSTVRRRGGRGRRR